ncbi:hypothetical protein G5B39_18395 (plasmid) [Rhodobacteraceae bacterium SC52]|nr:hypothetical protein G5B39_18395 [Rhodobacteraceae bacterium SC52]
MNPDPNPAATNGGPSPVSELRLSATLSFRGTEDRVGVFSSGKIGVTDVAASVSTIVVPGLHDGTVDIVGFREPEIWPVQQSGMTGVRTPTGNSGQLIFLFEDRYGRDRPFFSFIFRLPGLLNGEMNLSGAYFDYEYRESPIRFDSPKYRSAYSSSTWSVTRTTLEQASTTAPIPLPASLGFAASGLLLLTLTGRRRART